MENQGKRPDQVEWSEKVAVIGAIIIAIVVIINLFIEITK
jgi:hypothetical protein